MNEVNFLIARAKEKKKYFSVFLFVLATEILAMILGFYYMCKKLDKEKIAIQNSIDQIKENFQPKSNNPSISKTPNLIHNFSLLLDNISTLLPQKAWLISIKMSKKNIKLTGRFAHFSDSIEFEKILTSIIPGYKMGELLMKKDNSIQISFNKVTSDEK